MPAAATPIAPQVRPASRWPRTKRDISAVSNGPIDIVTSTLATEVIVIATMNAVYITDQHRPDTHTGHGERTSWRQNAGPRIAVNAMAFGLGYLLARVVRV